MPWFSYHGGHSGQFCRHAKGSLADVVERAWRAGFSHYGLSEHCPRKRAEDLFEDEADLGVEGLVRLFDEYRAEALRLKDQYADRLEVLVGFETERLPPTDWAPTMKALRDRFRPDFIIGSVHHVDGHCIDYSKERSEAVFQKLGGRVAVEQTYFDHLAEMVEELRPEVVGHLDLIRKFDGDSAGFAPEVWPHIDRALESLEAAGSVLDVNAGAYRRGLSPVYPLPEILQRGREMGIGATLGDDSHGAHDVGVGLDACMQALDEAGYRQVTYFARIDGAVQRREADLAAIAPRSESGP